MRFRPGLVFVTGFPFATLFIVAGCLAGFIVELFQGGAISEFLQRYGVVPLQVLAYFGNVAGTSFVRSVLPFFSSIFLHGGYLHLLTNMMFLWMVGDVVESWLGRTRFLVLVVFGVLAELIVRIGMTQGSGLGEPSVGISGAVAALIGGFLVVLSRLGATQDKPVPLGPRLPLVIGVLAWFPLQLLNPYFALAGTCQTSEPTSWTGLLLSFVFGMFLVSLSGPGRAPSSSEAVAFPREETAPLHV